MGTHATARLQQGDEFIDFHTRWDGFEQETRDIFENLITHTVTSVEALKKGIDPHTPQIERWMSDMLALVEEQRVNPSLAGMGSLFCSRSLNHYMPLIHHSNYKDDDYAYDDKLGVEPDFILNIQQANKGVDSASSKNWRIGRVTLGGSFTDFRYRLSEIEMMQKISSMPHFWRDLYFSVSRFKNSIDFDKQSILKLNSLMPFGHVRVLDRFVPKNQDHAHDLFLPNTSCNFGDEKADIKNAINDVLFSAGFDMSCSAFISHLCLRMPLDVAPLLYSEIDLERKPDLVIDISSNALSTILMSGPDINLNQAANQLLDYISVVNKEFAETTGLKSTYLQNLLADKAVDPGMIGLNYEENVIRAMDSVKHMYVDPYARNKNKSKKSKNKIGH